MSTEQDRKANKNSDLSESRPGLAQALSSFGETMGANRAQYLIGAPTHINPINNTAISQIRINDDKQAAEDNKRLLDGLRDLPAPLPPPYIDDIEIPAANPLSTKPRGRRV